MFQYSPPQSPTHVCGLYYVVPVIGCHVQKHFLPQVKLEAKATILSTTSQTVLTQTFVNPSREKGIRECRYTFPLYDGVSVVGFTCQIGERKIVGQVKEREKARAVFNEAVARGETAGLLEQLPEASDVFSTTVGNIPPGAKVIIDITYLGELKHDMEIDGIRFTIPNIIYPRYGDYPGTLQRSLATDAMGRSISITVDAEMADGSFIQKIQSPTHPIAVTMGTTSVAPNADPAMTKASATLTLGTAGLQTDFVLQVIAKNTGVPKAILENHPRIPNQRALMATLVPKFALPPEKPEIVFICDRSGSMGGSRIELAKQALKVFLKSLPVGVKFNICSFGWRHTFLWPRSVTYSQQTLDEAMRHADTFLADYGGTIMLEPLKATIQQRYQDMPLDIMLLTDGEDWNQQNIFSYLNETIIDTKAPIRVFTLGIGNGVSHAMIEGIAKAGNGFSQAVGEGEAMNTKVVRMLKGALSPHINDYTLEVKYNNDEVSAHLDVEPEDDFEIIEKASDSLKVKIAFRDEKVEKEQTKKPISLFDSTVDPDKEEEPEHDETGENRYAHLPKLPVPNIIQAPQNIPSLFAFHRASVYLLLSPGAPQGTPTSVILRGTSAHGPLELEIPIQVLDKPGETIHQLAAKKAISELEQGRGWLKEAKDESNTLIKKKFEGRYNDMVEREAVRLGVQFQVGGKWCSFVAVEAKHKEAEEQKKNAKEWQWLEDEGDDTPQDQQPMTQPAVSNNGIGARYTMNPPGWNNNAGLAARTPAAAFPSMNLSNPSPFQNRAYGSMSFSSAGPGSSSGPGSFAFGQASQSGGSSFGAPTPGVWAAFGASNSMSSGGLFGSSSTQSSGGLFGSSNPNTTAPFGTANSSGSSLFGAPTANRGASFGSSSSANSNVFNNTAHSSNSQLFGSTGITSTSTFGAPAQQQSHTGSSLFGAPNTSSQGKSELEQYQMGLMVLRQENKKRNLMARQEYDNTQSNQVSKGSLFGDVAPPSSSRVSGPLSGETLLHHMISLQSFSGSWSLTPELLETLDLDPARVRAEMDAAKLDETVFATALVIAIFEERLAAWKGSWELVVEKAQGWLQEQVAGGGDDAVDRCLKCARKVWD